MIQKVVDQEAWSRWWESPLGLRVLRAECERLLLRWPHLFGFHTLMLGFSDQSVLMDGTVIPTRTIINPASADIYGERPIKGRWEALPLLQNSIDVIVAPHCLELSSDPEEVLKEIDRVLIPEGHLLLFGINPYSLWRYCALPHVTGWHSAAWVRQHLIELGFTILRREYFFLQPPWLSWFNRLSVMNRLSWLGLGGMSGIYFIEAQKKVQGMRLLKAEARTMQKVKVTAPIATSRQI